MTLIAEGILSRYVVFHLLMTLEKKGVTSPLDTDKILERSKKQLQIHAEAIEAKAETLEEDEISGENLEIDSLRSAVSLIDDALIEFSEARKNAQI